MPRIYLDNAATSWPKPDAVYQAVENYQRGLGAPAGRGVYAEATEVERLVNNCRKKVAQLINEADPTRVIFTQNGTDSLNLAIHGWLQPGDHVVTSACEHNSVLRPLRFLAEHRNVRATYVGCDAHGCVDPGDIRRAIQPQTRLIALTHASNVTGAIQPVEEVGKIAKERGICFLVDAAQTLGHMRVDVQRIGCQMLAAPGHKGLLGPLGTGVLYIAPGVEAHLLPIRQGGTGTRSDEEIQPTTLPDRFESGNLNVPGIVGLGAGVSQIIAYGVDEIEKQIDMLTQRLLREIPGCTFYGPPAAQKRAGIVSLNLAGYDPQELASLLDSQWSIQTRAGLHCAPRMHAALGTAPSGTLRLSVGMFNTAEQIDQVIAALREIAQ